MTEHSLEVKRGDRFEFGANWSLFLQKLNDQRIAAAMTSLEQMLGKGYLQGKTMLDIGSGSGLFSLAARKLGAKVTSFDYDAQSVACTRELKRRYFSEDTDWTIHEGSVLDQSFLARLKPFDVVYSWGVLHHTGAMWQALDNVVPLVNRGGRLFIALYNDQGRVSTYWQFVKRIYCKSPRLIKSLILLGALVRLWGPTTLRDFIKGRPGATWRNYGSGDGRGMSPWRDLVDWVGGYPFEVATPQQIESFYRTRGFVPVTEKTCGTGHACNEYVFERLST